MNEWERLHQQAKRYQAEYPVLRKGRHRLLRLQKAWAV